MAIDKLETSAATTETVDTVVEKDIPKKEEAEEATKEAETVDDPAKGDEPIDVEPEASEDNKAVEAPAMEEKEDNKRPSPTAKPEGAAEPEAKKVAVESSSTTNDDADSSTDKKEPNETAVEEPEDSKAAAPADED